MFLLLLVLASVTYNSMGTVLGDQNGISNKNSEKDKSPESEDKNLQINQIDVVPERTKSKSAILSFHDAQDNYQDTLTTKMNQESASKDTDNYFSSLPVDTSNSKSLFLDSKQRVDDQSNDKENLSTLDNTGHSLLVGNKILEPSKVIYANCEIRISQLPADAETSLACPVPGADSEDRVIATINTPSTSFAIASAFSTNADEVDINIKNLDHKKQISGQYEISLIIFR
jgi:hypothetical protein